MQDTDTDTDKVNTQDTDKVKTQDKNTLAEEQLAQLIADYEYAHSNYMNSVKNKNTKNSQKYLRQLDELNQNIIASLTHINSHISNMTQETDKLEVIASKKKGLSKLAARMQVDKQKITALRQDMHDIDGSLESLTLQRTVSLSYMIFYSVIIAILCVFILRMLSPAPNGFLENFVILIALIAFGYMGRRIYLERYANLLTTLKNNTQYDSSSWIFRLVN